MAADARRPNVLFVDDDEDFATAIARLLESAGYAVRLAGDGEEGLRLAREAPPDLVLLDFLMPVKDGFETCRELRRLPGLAEVPIVALTAYGGDIGRLHGFPDEGSAEVQATVEKPVEPNVLLRCLADALAGARGG